ncbi:MAG: prolyl oligopeptidase family serine peptidase, partial [Candidatus Methylomirabilis sp.]|nr:prolyl oligopeptidase family serine peptidase [Deltaproteobacteria bacterium]
LQRGGVLPRPVRDVQDALAFIRERAGEYGVDPERLFLGGFSAGGALALLAAGMPHREGGPPKVRGVASVFPPTDFSRLRGGTATTLRHLLTRARTAEGMRARSPVAHADFEAPVRVIHGDADEMVPIAHSERFVAERKRLGREAELLVYEGAPHTFNCLEDTEYPERCVRDLVDFVRAHTG